MPEGRFPFGVASIEGRSYFNSETRASCDHDPGLRKNRGRGGFSGYSRCGVRNTAARSLAHEDHSCLAGHAALVT